MFRGAPLPSATPVAHRVNVATNLRRRHKNLDVPRAGSRLLPIPLALGFSGAAPPYVGQDTTAKRSPSTAAPLLTGM